LSSQDRTEAISSPVGAGRLQSGGTQALAKDHAADSFHDVVEPYLGDALALARWLTGNIHDAEDVVQESCLRAHAGIGGFAGRNARGWFLSIVRHTCFTWLAKHRPNYLVYSGDPAELADAAPSDSSAAHIDFTPEERLISKQQLAAVEKAIGNLPYIHREILVLRDVNGLAYREIAELLSIPMGTVMSRLAKAREMLMAELERQP
jgi:RNA polymerase sigma-70 factor (ECF subfamily)